MIEKQGETDIAKKYEFASINTIQEKRKELKEITEGLKLKACLEKKTLAIAHVYIELVKNTNPLKIKDKLIEVYPKDKNELRMIVQLKCWYLLRGSFLENIFIFLNKSEVLDDREVYNLCFASYFLLRHRGYIEVEDSKKDLPVELAKLDFSFALEMLNNRGDVKREIDKNKFFVFVMAEMMGRPDWGDDKKLNEREEKYNREVLSLFSSYMKKKLIGRVTRVDRMALVQIYTLATSINGELLQYMNKYAPELFERIFNFLVRYMRTFHQDASTVASVLGMLNNFSYGLVFGKEKWEIVKEELLKVTNYRTFCCENVDKIFEDSDGEKKSYKEILNGYFKGIFTEKEISDNRGLKAFFI